MNLCKFYISNILIALFLAGCVMPVSTNIKPTTENVAKYKGLSALEVVAALEKNVNMAEKTGMPFLAPNYFREARQVLSESKSALTGGMTREVAVNNAAKGDAILEKGRSIMEIVKYRFSKELEFKDQLNEEKAPKLLPKEYATVIEELSRLITRVEREQPGNIDKDKLDLLRSMSALVIKTVQVGALRESETINEESRKNNAEKQAPLTYAEALRVYRNSMSKIAAGYRDKVLVRRLGEAALFTAHHAKYVNERVALLQTQLKISVSSRAMKNSGAQAGTPADGKPPSGEVTVEQIVLQEEDRLRAISTALRLPDMRDQPLEKQVEAIKRASAEATLQAYGARSDKAGKGNGRGLGNLEKKTRLLEEKEKQLAEKDRLIAEKDKQLAAKNKELARRNAQIKALKNKLRTMELL